MKPFIKTAFVISVLLGLMACQPSAPTQKKVVFSGPMMGTQYRVVVLLEQEHLIQEDLYQEDLDQEYQEYVETLESDIIDAMEMVNQTMSTYLPSSELSKLNQAPSNTPIELSKSLFDVIDESLRIGRLSNGAFDITIGNATDLWGFGSSGAISNAPTEQELAKVKQSTGYQNLELQGNTMTKKVDGISLDLSAIAKGYAVDQVAKTLDRLNINNYLIDIGGELRSAGFSNNRKAWSVAIEKPHILGGIQQLITLTDKSIATSGDYRNYHIINDQQFSHTIDAVTLKPVFHRLALVSVIDENASTADGLATAIMALGDEKGWAFAKRHDLTVYMVVRGNEKDKYRIQMTEKFKHYLQ